MNETQAQDTQKTTETIENSAEEKNSGGQDESPESELSDKITSLFRKPRATPETEAPKEEDTKEEQTQDDTEDDTLSPDQKRINDLRKQTTQLGQQIKTLEEERDRFKALVDELQPKIKEYQTKEEDQEVAQIRENLMEKLELDEEGFADFEKFLAENLDEEQESMLSVSVRKGRLGLVREYFDEFNSQQSERQTSPKRTPSTASKRASGFSSKDALTKGYNAYLQALSSGDQEGAEAFMARVRATPKKDKQSWGFSNL